MLKVELNGATFAYHDLGSGPPLLLLHGFTGTAHAHLEAMIDDLKADYRVIAPDLRGYGASRPPERDFPRDFYARDATDMAMLLDHIQPGPVAVLGFSDGAESGLLLAAARPDLVRGVVAWGVGGVISAPMVAAARRWLPAESWVTERSGWRNEIIELHGEASFVPMVEGWVAAAEAIFAAGGNICLNEATQISCPVLLINGHGEMGNLPEDVTRLADRIANCRLEFVTNSGHSIQDDQPAELMTLVRTFLAGL